MESEVTLVGEGSVTVRTADGVVVGLVSHRYGRATLGRETIQRLTIV
jgi:hypothetical protein